MSLFTFDWSQINWLGSPLVTPWWAEVNIGVGSFIGLWVVVPAMYYSNVSRLLRSILHLPLADHHLHHLSQVWSFAYLPVQSSGSYDRFGNAYNYTRVLTAERGFDAEAYLNYSPLYLTAALTMTYMAAMMVCTAAVVQTILFNGKGIYQALRGNSAEKEDVHARLMKTYKPVPYW